MIQGGCPDGNGMGGPGYCIKGEFSHNGFQNDLAHTEGVLSMARAMNPNSAGSQFFIMHKDAPYLNGEYAAFGQVIDGMDIVNKIAEVRTDYSDRPDEGTENQIHHSRDLRRRVSGTGEVLIKRSEAMQEIRYAMVDGEKVPVLISDENEALQAAKAARRAIVELWREDGKENMNGVRTH